MRRPAEVECVLFNLRKEIKPQMESQRLKVLTDFQIIYSQFFFFSFNFYFGIILDLSNIAKTIEFLYIFQPVSPSS